MSWIENFMAARLRELREVQDFEVTAPNTFHIVRKAHEPVIVTAVAGGGNVTEDTLKEAQEQIRSADFVVVIKKESVIRQSAFDTAAKLGVGIGTYADFLRALEEEDMRAYISKEAQYVLRSIGQHSKVSNVQRMDDSKYLVKRLRGKPMTIIMVYEYEVGADAIRTAWQTYGPATLFVCANPNAHVSTLAREAAASIGVSLAAN